MGLDHALIGSKRFARAGSLRSLSRVALIFAGLAVVCFGTDEGAVSKRADALIEARDYASAHAVLTDGLKEFPESAQLLRMRGRIYFYAGKTGEALADLGRAVDLKPKDPELLMLRGEVRSAMQQYELAVEDFDAAITAKSGNYRAYMLRAAAYRSLGKLSEASADIGIAVLGTREKSPEALVEQAWIRLIQGNAADALASAEKAAELGSDEFTKVWVCQALAFYQLRRFEDSKLAYSKSLGLLDVPLWRIGRAQALVQLGDYASAVADLSVVIKREPDHQQACVHRADAFSFLGEFDKARDDYARAFRIGEKSDTYARLRSLVVSRRLKQQDQDAAFAEESGKWPYGVQWLVARFFLGATDEQDLLQSLKEADNKTPREDWCVAYYHLGMARLINGDPEKARYWLRRCTETDCWILPEYLAAKAELARMDAGAK